MAVPNFEDFDPDFAGPAAWAEMYRHYGLQIIPCLMPAKRPLLSEWRSLQQELVPDATFRRWYDPATGEHRNRYDMGIITGACSGGAFILDLDTPKHPEAAQWWYDVCRVHNNGMEPDTPHQQTGGGGQQWLFRAPPGWTPPTNKTSLGVDLRGQGGFAVMPRSRHGSGKAYEWVLPPWEVAILEAPGWLCQEIDKLVGLPGNINSGELKLPPQSTDSLTAKTVHGGDFDGFGHRIDGREEAMRDMVWRCVVKLYRQSPIMPVGWSNLIEAEYEVYERTVSVQNPIPGESKRDGLDRENRGFRAFTAKWHYAMAQWDTDVARAAAQPDPHPEKPDLAGEFQEAADKAHAQAKANPADRYPYLNVKQIKATPEPVWLVDELISEKIVGFIFGTYGTLKTFIGIDIGLSIATGRPSWWGRKLNRQGAVIYICVEGSNRLKHRLAAWEAHRGVNADDHPFFLIEKTINFMNPADVGKLLATVQAAKDEAGCEVVAVFVDTVSRVLPGAKENQQEHMSLFVGACDMVREAFSTTVIGIHHANKEGEFRGSSVLPAAGDFVLEVKRQPGDMHGSIYAYKVKDAEDGWEKKFTVTKVPIGDIAGRVSLVLDLDDTATTERGEWPDKEKLRQVLVEADKAWLAGKPWSASPNSRDRFAARIMWVKFGIPAKLAKSIVETWLINEVLSEEIVNSHSKLKGLKVIGSVD